MALVRIVFSSYQAEGPFKNITEDHAATRHHMLRPVASASVVNRTGHVPAVQWGRSFLAVML